MNANCTVNASTRHLYLQLRFSASTLQTRFNIRRSGYCVRVKHRMSNGRFDDIIKEFQILCGLIILFWLVVVELSLFNNDLCVRYFSEVAYVWTTELWQPKKLHQKASHSIWAFVVLLRLCLNMLPGSLFEILMTVYDWKSRLVQFVKFQNSGIYYGITCTVLHILMKPAFPLQN